MDSRLRGNDVDGGGNDGGECGIDGGECGIDGGECGIDGDECGNYGDGDGIDGGECGNDGDGGDAAGGYGGSFMCTASRTLVCCLRGRLSPRRRQTFVQSLQTSQTQFLQAKLRVMVGRPMMSS